MNSPFPSCPGPKPLFQSEANCDHIEWKMSFYSKENNTHFHKKCFALSLILKVRVVGILKWRIRVLKSQMNLNYNFAFPFSTSIFFFGFPF